MESEDRNIVRNISWEHPVLRNRDKVEDQALWTRGIKILLYLGLNNLAQLSGAIKYFRNVLTGRNRDIACKSTSVLWRLVRDV